MDERRRLEFQTLASEHLDFLLRFASRLAGERSDAEDLVQDTLLKAWRAFDRFRPGTSFRAWTGRILMNTFLNDREKRRRWVRGIDPDTFPAEARSAVGLGDGLRAPALAALAGERFGDEVVAALRELPGEMAAAVTLADVEELTYEEIAELMGTPIGTVRSRIARGRRHLRARLAGHAQRSGLGGGAA